MTVETPLFTDAQPTDWPPMGAETTPVPEAVEQDQADVDAPYGRKANGEPYKVPPEQRNRLREALAQGRAVRAAAATGTKKKTPRTGGGSSAPRASSTGRTSKPAGPDYASTIQDLMVFPIVGLSAAAQFTGNPALMLDSMAMAMHSPTIAAAGAQFAQDNAWLASFLDRVQKISPAATLISAFLGLGAQVAVNHKMIPPAVGAGLGALPPDELARMMSEPGDGGDIQP